jgi:hypothetical protein
VQVGLRLGKALRVGEADGEAGQKPCAEDREFGQDQDPHHQVAGQGAVGQLFAPLRALIAGVAPRRRPEGRMSGRFHPVTSCR